MLLFLSKSGIRNMQYSSSSGAINKLVQHRLLNISCQVEQLKNRALVRISGDDVTSFLQGIVTNDMRHFQDGYSSLFTMFLNTKGRVLYDSIIYKTRLPNTFFIECDQNGLEDIVKHLKMYRVRRKIDVVSVHNEWKPWVLFNPKEVEVSNNNTNNVKQEQVVPCTLPNLQNDKGQTYLNEIVISDESVVYRDPRLPSLGSRVLAPANENVTELLRNSGIKIETSSPWSYRMFRYRLGVGEGIEELPIGKCFPLEANCDYLHGVSFHKGCYIGQELTARTHHTGVVRKRLMPLVLHSDVSSDNFVIDTPIEDPTGMKKTAIGKLRGIEKNCALGLMRIAEALEINKLKIKSVEGEPLRPFWWPQELPKERMDTGSKRG